MCSFGVRVSFVEEALCFTKYHKYEKNRYFPSTWVVELARFDTVPFCHIIYNAFATPIPHLLLSRNIYTLKNRCVLERLNFRRVDNGKLSFVKKNYGKQGKWRGKVIAEFPEKYHILSMYGGNVGDLICSYVFRDPHRPHYSVEGCRLQKRTLENKDNPFTPYEFICH